MIGYLIPPVALDGSGYRNSVSFTKVNPETCEATAETETSVRVRSSNRQQTADVNISSSTAAFTPSRPSDSHNSCESNQLSTVTVTKTASTTTLHPEPTPSSTTTTSVTPANETRGNNNITASTLGSFVSTSVAPSGGLILRQFEAHKVILSACCPVFAAMFEHDMEESRVNRVEIADMEPDTLAEVLRYIYTGKVVGLDKLAHDLLVAADKYQLERLKIMCEAALVKELSVENACDILELADIYNAKQLKAHVLKFITLHSHDVCFEQLVRHNPRLLNECLCSLTSQKLHLLMFRPQTSPQTHTYPQTYTYPQTQNMVYYE